MSISNSDLARYNDTNVDMTVSVTERALNSQLRQYLASISTASKVDAYQVRVYILSFIRDDGTPVTFTVDKNTDYSKIPDGFPSDLYDAIKTLNNNNSSLYAELEKLKLFQIPTGTKVMVNMSSTSQTTLTENEKNIQTAAAYYVKYAIYIEDGMPDSALIKLLDDNFKGDPDSVIKPITLNPNEKNVLFKQFFRNICGLQISSSVTGMYPKMKIYISLSKSEQMDSDIWYFPFKIALDFRAVDYHNCDNLVKQKIQQMAKVENPDDVFNISQLSLDLKTLSTTYSPTIKEFDHDVDTFLTNIIRSYFDRLEKAGQTVFGSVITTKPASTTKYLFTPKMRNYHVAPRTLDYLIGFGTETTIPNLGNDINLAWDSDRSPIISLGNPNDAAIAISSAHLLPFIAKMVRPALNYLPNKIEVFADDPVWKDQFTVTSKSNPQKNNPDFTKGGTAGNPNFEYSYCYEDQTDRHYMWQPPLPTPVASLKLKHKYSADVTGRAGNYDFGNVILPAFIFDFTIKGWLLIDYNTNEGTQGTYFDTTVKMAIGIRIDSQTGNIDFVKKVDTIDHHPSGLPTSGWVEFMSAQNIKNYVHTLVENLTTIMNCIEKYSIDEFVKSVNSQIGFVMPGSKTFTFVYDKPNGTVNAISPSGDLYLYGNYVQELAK